MSRGNVNFETVFEKIARIMARSYGIDVIIEGNTAWTDGKKIVLPMLEDVNEELRADLNGFLDHEVAHCKFTDFDAGKKWVGRFHRELSNAIEDSRIEKLLPLEYPGTALNLERMNQKWQSKLDEKRDKMPWAIRFLLTIRDIYDGKPIRKDEQIEPLVAAVLPEAKALVNCKNTYEVVDQTAEIIRLVNLAREKMFKGMPPADDDAFDELDEMRETPIELDPDRKEREGKEAKSNTEQLDPATEYKKDKGKGDESDSEGEDSDESESGEGEGKGDEGDQSEAGDSEAGDKASVSAEKEGKEKGKGDKSNADADDEGESDGIGEGEDEESADSGKSGESDKSKGKLDEKKDKAEKGDPKSDNDADERKSQGDTTVDKLETRKNYANWTETAAEKKMLEDGLDEPSEFDKHEFNTESYMDAQFEKAVAKEPKVQNLRGMYSGHRSSINPKHVSVPFTREYDKVTDYSGRGDRNQYADRKRMVMKHVNPIKQHLERVLLVKENKKMIPERERGMLNNRTLANLCIDKNYRTPFRQFSKIDTTNVAVSLVIDCSGSMSGNKIEVARQTGLALGESLKALGITFEIVGFNTNDYVDMSRKAKGLSADAIARFNRYGTGLNHMIFKSFDSNDLSGICNAKAGGCNADGESITWAAKRLAERKEKRKIMIVLSDGQPSYGGANHEVLAGDLKRVINLMPKSGIEPIGIGICTDDPKLFYDDYVIVNDVSKLSTVVVSKLAKLLEEGYK